MDAGQGPEIRALESGVSEEVVRRWLWILAFVITGFSTMETRRNIRPCACLKDCGIKPQDAEAVVSICAP